MKKKLLDIYGIGPKLADKLLKFFPKKFTGNVREFLKSNDNILSMLPEAAKADLAYNPVKNIPRSIIDAVNNKIMKIPRCIIAGSYLRGAQVSHDIDLVATNSTSFEEIAFITGLEFTEPYSQGPDRLSTYIINGGQYYKIDIFFTNDQEYIYMVLYATGSKEFNIKMRSMAKKKGLVLNQKGLYKAGKQVKNICTEEDIFEHLGMKWVPPHKRI